MHHHARFALLVIAGIVFAPAKPARADLPPDEVARRVRAWQPTASERRWEQIGWARDIRDALRIAKRTDRPVFLFTHDGRLSVGRC
jgi:hypothetical protein